MLLSNGGLVFVVLQLVPLQGFGIVFILFVVVFLVFTALWVWVSYWVYTDAIDRGIDSPALWGVITLVGGVVGLLVYVLVREG